MPSILYLFFVSTHWELYIHIYTYYGSCETTSYHLWTCSMCYINLNSKNISKARSRFMEEMCQPTYIKFLHKGKKVRWQKLDDELMKRHHSEFVIWWILKRCWYIPPPPPPSSSLANQNKNITFFTTKSKFHFLQRSVNEIK